MIVKAAGEKSSEEEHSRTLADTDEARFARLLQAADLQPDVVGWTDVLNPDKDFEGIRVGQMISWECDLYIPQILRVMSQSGDALGAMDMLGSLVPAGETLGLDMGGLPGGEQVQAISDLIKGMRVPLVIVGEDDDTEWRVAGELHGEFVHGELEGRARVVGKVSQVLPLGRSKPYLTFPGINLVARAERRKLERQPPPPGKEDEYLSGPAIRLDVLAVYR